jgi:hypothetical protein
MPLLGALTTAPNGTRYFPLTGGSPAINAGDNQAVTDAGLTQDQAGRARVVWGTVDIGALEYQAESTGTDVNGDGVVSPADAVYVVNRLGTNDPTADVDGDEAITQDDVQQVLNELGTMQGTP